MEFVRVPVSAHYAVVDDEVIDREYCFADVSASEVADLLMRGFGLSPSDLDDLNSIERRNVA